MNIAKYLEIGSYFALPAVALVGAGKVTGSKSRGAAAAFATLVGVAIAHRDTVWEPLKFTGTALSGILLTSALFLPQNQAEKATMAERTVRDR